EPVTSSSGIASRGQTRKSAGYKLSHVGQRFESGLIDADGIDEIGPEAPPGRAGSGAVPRCCTRDAAPGVGGSVGRSEKGRGDGTFDIVLIVLGLGRKTLARFGFRGAD